MNASLVLKYQTNSSGSPPMISGQEVHMIKDTVHYIECHHKAGNGDNDILSIAIRLPSGTTEIPIEASHFRREISGVEGYTCKQQGDNRYPDFVDCVSKSTAQKIEEYYDDLQDMLETVQNTSSIPVDTTLKNAAEIQNKLLEEMTKEEEAKNHTVDASQFLQTVEKLGVAIADKMDEKSTPVIELRKNLALQVGIFDTTFLFPNYSNPEFQNKEWSTNDVIKVFHKDPNQSISRRSFGVLYQNLDKLITNESPIIKIHNNSAAEQYNLNSRIIGCTLSPPPCFTCNASITDITVSLTHKKEQDNAVICAFMNFTESGISWSTEGCFRIPEKSNKSQTTCRCSHLTNFAVLMQVKEVKIPSKHILILSIITYIGCSLSLIGLILTVAALIVLPGLLSAQRNIIHLHLAISLALAEIVFLIGIQATSNQTGCIVVAALVQYLFLVAFGCMLVEGFYLYVMVVKVFGTGNFTVWPFIVGAWGVPIFIVSLTLGVSVQHFGRLESCWLSVQSGTVWAFVAPVLFVIALNSLFLCWVLAEVLRAQAYTEGQASKINNARTGAKSTIILLPLLGVTWVFGLLTFNQGTLVFQYLFAIFNSLQGFFVFIFHCVLNTEVQKAFKRKRYIWSSRVILLSQGKNKNSYEDSSRTKCTNRETEEKKELSKEFQPFATEGSFCASVDETEGKERDKKRDKTDQEPTVANSKPMKKHVKKSYNLNSSYQKNRSTDLMNQKHELKKRVAPNKVQENNQNKEKERRDHVGCTACHSRKETESKLKKSQKPQVHDNCAKFDDLTKPKSKVGPEPCQPTIKLEITETSSE